MQSHIGGSPKNGAPSKKFDDVPLVSSSPPTDQMRKILRLVQHLHHGKVDLKSGWNTFRLRCEDYRELIIQIRQDPSLWDFVEDKLR